MNELLRQAEKIIQKKFSKDDNNYGLLVLSCFALLSKFGELYTPIIEKVMIETDIFIDSKNLSEIIDNSGLDAERFLGSEMFDDDGYVVTAISYPGLDLFVTSQGEVICKRGTPAIFCTTIEKNSNNLLNSFVHEASHLIKATINDIYFYSNSKLLIRSGLNIFGYSTKDGKIRKTNKNSMLDEVINVLQTSDMMRAVKNLDGVTMSNEVFSFFKTLDLERIDDLYGYDDLVDFVLPLWSNEHFRNNVENNIVVGKICRIKNDFDSILGTGAFKCYSSYLDYVNDNFDDDDLINDMKNWYNRMNEHYMTKTKITKKRKVHLLI